MHVHLPFWQCDPANAYKWAVSTGRKYLLSKVVLLESLPSHLVPMARKMIGVLEHDSALWRLYWAGDNLGSISLRCKSSFLSTKYTSFGANLPPKSFSEMAPWANEMNFVMNQPMAGIKSLVRTQKTRLPYTQQSNTSCRIFNSGLEITSFCMLYLPFLCQLLLYM